MRRQPARQRTRGRPRTKQAAWGGSSALRRADQAPHGDGEQRRPQPRATSNTHQSAASHASARQHRGELPLYGGPDGASSCATWVSRRLLAAWSALRDVDFHPWSSVRALRCRIVSNRGSCGDDTHPQRNDGNHAEHERKTMRDLMAHRRRGADQNHQQVQHG